MRILLVSQSFPPQPGGGAEQVALWTAEALAARHPLQVLSLAHDQGHALSASEHPLALRIPQHNFYISRKSKAEYPRLMKAAWHLSNAIGGTTPSDIEDVLQGFRPDVVYAHQATLLQPQLARAAERNAIPMVLHLHDYGHLCPRGTMFRPSAPPANCPTPCRRCRLLTRSWRHALAPVIRDVIAVSAAQRDRHQAANFLPQARWHVVPNAEAPDRAAAYHRPPPDTGRAFTFGFLGSFGANKGLPLLIRAFRHLPAGQARLLIAGSGTAAQEAALISLAGQMHHPRSGAIEWLGQCDANLALARMDALVVPSLWHEPGALVLHEALNRGLPVIASRRGGTPEQLAKDPAARLFDPDQPGALLRQMQRLLAHRPPPPPSSALGARSLLFDRQITRIESILHAAIHD